MKLIQKSLLFASLLGVGASVTSIPTIANTGVTVEAATMKNKTTKIASKTLKVKVSKAQLYNEKGKKLSTCLKKNKECKTTEKRVINGKTYYKVGTKNEYVKASDISWVK